MRVVVTIHGLEGFVAPGRIVVKAGKGEKRNCITLCMGMAHIFVGYIIPIIPVLIRTNHCAI